MIAQQIHPRKINSHRRLDGVWKRLRATRSPGRQPHAASSTPADLSRLTNEELKEKLEFIMGPPEEPDPEELVYSGPRWRLTAIAWFDHIDDSGKLTGVKSACACSIQELAEQFNKEPFIQVGEGPGGFPFIQLRHDSGAEAIIHLHGGTVSSWSDADGLEMLFVHPDNDFDPRQPIRCANVFCHDSFAA